MVGAPTAPRACGGPTPDRPHRGAPLSPHNTAPHGDHEDGGGPGVKTERRPPHRSPQPRTDAWARPVMWPPVGRAEDAGTTAARSGAPPAGHAGGSPTPAAPAPRGARGHATACHGTGGVSPRGHPHRCGQARFVGWYTAVTAAAPRRTAPAPRGARGHATACHGTGGVSPRGHRHRHRNRCGQARFVGWYTASAQMTKKSMPIMMTDHTGW
ncbi:hypothetical protein TUSST3_25310 [Streptomyces sp. TUS-ST3]|nr:hypothetical protein TUSST3_25310 [Streptomyces sp. TUS-ST3]